MSSDTFRYRVEKVEGRDVVLEIRPTTAGGLCDLAWSRSFVLMLLREHGAPVTFEQTMDTRWLAQHLGEYVVRVVPERLVGHTSESSLRSVATDWCIPAEHLQPRLSVRATLASEALAAVLPVGASAGTTAFDVWGNDPEQVALVVRAETPPIFDAQPGIVKELEAAVGERLRGWRSTPLLGLHRVGADAQLRVRFSEGYSGLPRSTAQIEVQVDVPAFEALPGPARAPFGRTFLVSAKLHDGGAMSAYWFRHFVGASSAPRLEYFDDDAPQEPFDAFVDRIACTLEPPGLDALLTRDGLRGLLERGLQTLPRKKGQSPVTSLGGWAEPTMPDAWRWEWKHGQRWRPEPIWNRVALHAAFGTRDEAQAALAQARALAKQVPAGLKPLIASLDAK
jgi:hypothetical protein